MADLRRRELIARHLRAGPVESQEELAAALREEGVETTQATISRDLAALGALKGAKGYVLPDARPADVPEERTSVVSRHVLSAAQADSLVVVRTAPGHANVVAVTLDRLPPKGVVGTLAGDDTVFLATTSRAAAQRLVSELRSTLRRG